MNLHTKTTPDGDTLTFALGDQREELTQRVVDLLHALEPAVRAEIPPATPLDEVRKNMLSIAVQVLWNTALDEGYEPTTVMTGISHALAAILAQAPQDLAHKSMAFLFAQILGHEAVTRDVFSVPEGVTKQ